MGAKDHSRNPRLTLLRNRAVYVTITLPKDFAGSERLVEPKHTQRTLGICMPPAWLPFIHARWILLCEFRCWMISCLQKHLTECETLGANNDCIDSFQNSYVSSSRLADNAASTSKDRRQTEETKAVLRYIDEASQSWIGDWWKGWGLARFAFCLASDPP